MATRSGDKSLEIRMITTESDIPQLARVKTAAFKDYDLHVAMYPVENGDVMQTFNEERERLEILNPSQTIVAVVDASRGSPTIVAYARWHIPSSVLRKQETAFIDPSTQDKLDSASSFNLHKSRPPPPPGTRMLLYTAFLEELSKMRSTHWDRERDYSKSICYAASHKIG
jgi:hypothetical protein